MDARHKAGHDELLRIATRPGGPESLTIPAANQQAVRGSVQELLFRLDSAYTLMVRRRACAVSNHEATVRLILRDAAKRPLLRMRSSGRAGAIVALLAIQEIVPIWPLGRRPYPLMLNEDFK